MKNSIIYAINNFDATGAVNLYKSAVILWTYHFGYK